VEWRVSGVAAGTQSILTSFSDPCILQSDKDSRGYYILAGRPRGHGYMGDVINPITEWMRDMRSKVVLPPSYLSHRRGVFAALSIGFSLGPGSLVSK
jgi:hypothetical protein